MRRQNAGVNIRVNETLREGFTLACELAGTTPSESIRRHMREIVGEIKWVVPTVEDRLAAITRRLEDEDEGY